MVEIKNSILPALEQIEKLHKIKKEEIIAAIENAITSAAKKYFGSECKIVTEIDIDTAESKTYIVKKVVETVTNPNTEISLQDAKTKNPDAKIGDEIKIVVDSEAFTRIAAQASKRVIVQRIKESDKKNVLAEIESQIGKVVPATVYNISGKTIIVDLGKTEGLLPQREQVFREKFRIGQHLKVLIKSVEQTSKGITVIVSRFDKEFIKKLFETEIPEIKEGIVEILNIVRAPGYRTKILVKTNNPKVDPVGACVGMKGTRIKPIIDELQGERIDLIPYSSDIQKLISYSLSPIKPDKTEIVDEKNKIAKVFVEQKLYETITSKNNINLNLAKELTGWNILVEPSKVEPKEKQEKEKTDSEPVSNKEEKN
jgi:N utilization substance protein A